MNGGDGCAGERCAVIARDQSLIERSSPLPNAELAYESRRRHQEPRRCRGVSVIAGLSLGGWDSNEPRGETWDGSHADVIVAITVRARDSRSRV